MSVERLITDNIDVWTSTVKTKSASGRGSSKKIELYGIKKLRELILELAVRGKLVPQDPTDEPASVLLERIAEEKAQLVKEKKIKKPKVLPDMEKDKPFVIPSNWSWSQLGFLTNYGVCDKAEPTSVSDDTWVLELEDVEKNTSKLLKKVRFSERAFKSTKNQFHPEDVIYGKLRPYLDKVLIADENGVCTTEMIPVRAYRDLTPGYLRLVMKSPYFINYANDSTHGMNLPRMGTDKARAVLFPLAPLFEQHRIVAKVGELMSLCDQLEQQTETSIEAHQTLVEVLLNTLTSSADAQELMQNWQRISEHFDALFITEKSIDTLKQTILQLAVMGKLVPQDPNDEPAAKLLERIAEEKAQLIKDKKIKKQKALPEITEDEKPFDLPSGWEWCHLGSACRKLTDGSHNPPPNHEGGYPMLSCKEIYDGGIDFSLASRFVDQSGYEKENKRTAIKSGDVLLNIVASIGRSAIVPEQFPPFVLQRNVAVLDSKIESQYLTEFLMSPIALDYYDKNAKGTAQKVIYLGKLSEMLIPVPPLPEQERIVIQLNELMGICSKLKTRLKESQTTQVHLTDAIIDKAL